MSGRTPAPGRPALLAVLFAFGLAAGNASSWYARSWQADDGLPGDNVTGVAQSPDGYLWIATQSGLARFDGIKMRDVPIPVGRPHPIIRALVLARDGVLWLALDGGGVVRLEQVHAEQLGTANGLPRTAVMDAMEAADGSIWISYLDGSVSRIVGRKARHYATEEGLTGAGPCSLTSDSNGELWYAKGGQVGKFHADRFAGIFPVGERYTQILAARHGGLWICAGAKLWKHVSGSTPVELGKIPGDAAAVRPTAVWEDQDGSLWIGTAATGLFRYDGETILPVETSHGRIRTIAQDREGNIWVGTDGGGLNRLRPQVVELQGREAGLPFDTVRSVCEDAAGTLWVVTQNGEVANNEGGAWRTIGPTEGWPGGQATSVACDTDGVVWLGTFSRGLYRWQEGQFSAVRRRDGRMGSSVRCLLADRAGHLWIAYAGETVLQRMTEGKFQNYDLPAGSKAVRALVEDAAGQVWMANLDAQLLRVEGDRVVEVTPPAGGAPRPIRSLAGAPDGSIWIGYSAAGVGRLKAGKFSLIGAPHGLPDESICSLMPDERGWFWFGSDHGIFRVSQDELAAVADGHLAAVRAVGYGAEDGLPSLQGYYGYSPGAARTRDGRILFPTHSGLAIVHPSRVRTNLVAPPVIIESVKVDGEEMLRGGEPEKLRLSPGYKKLEVTFTAPSFIEPEKVRFSHRLKGWDEDWSEAGVERGVSYSRLPAGQYGFAVKAGNNAGVWNEQGRELAFEVRPFFWQTWWFRAAATGVFTAGVYAAVRLVSMRRLRRKLRLLEHENILQRERARIAKDIHDDLGAHMTQISLLAELTEQAIAHPAQAGEHVRQIATMSRRGIKALDEIVWAVNPRNDTLSDLLDYAGQYAVNFLNAAGIRCRLDFPAEPVTRSLSSEVRHGLFLTLKEALNNAVKHSQATEVRITVGVHHGAMVWTIEDNGRGFAPPPDDALADGLRNMQQRLAELDGTYSIESKPGDGVKIVLSVPCPKREP
jgi:signal transduction histidine kinase/ligand-binding sensor domain-containing protein